MRIRELYLHPLKSGRSQRVEQAVVEAMGLRDDRRWMLATEGRGFLTGRQHPKLVLVEAVCDATGIQFQAPGMPSLRVEHAALRERWPVSIWKHQFEAWVGDDEADFWFSDYLGVACRLVFTDQNSERRTTRDPQAPVSFADGYPVLMIGSASLDDLNRRLAQPVSMRHFRPNIVVETREPYIEDGWRFVRINGVLFEHIKPCSRCEFITIDPDLGVKAADRQPLQTLNEYRWSDDGALFGINLIPRSEGELRVGDVLELV